MTPEIKTIAVIGAGELGREFALAGLLAGYPTILEDVSESRLAQAVEWVTSRAQSDDAMRTRLAVASTVEHAVRDADLIIEAVAEEAEMKIEMFTIFDKFAKPEAIFASTSSYVSIADLASMTFCPERCIGMRFLSTAAQIDILELKCAPETSGETVARCREVGHRMGREVTVIPQKQFTESR